MKINFSKFEAKNSGKMQAKPQFYNSPHFKNYWEKGSGKELLDWANVKIDIQNFQQYAHLYHEVDDLGDEAVKETYLKLPYSEASALVQKYSQNSISENDDAPESLKKLFLEMQEIPDWYDENLANIGARFCMKNGANALISLRDFSLMGGYDFAYLNKPLIFTGALKKGAVKRMKDTLEFWVHVTRENGFKPNSEAYQLIVRTRLMHAYARLKIKEKTQNWDTENWGEPINFWDMIATYTGFSLVFMQGLKKLGTQISVEEELGVFHLWKYIGYLLGIPAQFLPENRQQAVEQLYLWSSVQAQGDEDSAQLAKALLDENLESTIFKYSIQRKGLLYLHTSCSLYLIDKEIIERLQIPQVILPNVFPVFLKSINILSNKFSNFNKQKNYDRLVKIGHLSQMKVLADYIKHTPKDFHY